MFAAEWRMVLEAKPPTYLPADWWKLSSIPFFKILFFQCFSKRVTHRCAKTWKFLQQALASALEAGDWHRVKGCIARMERWTGSC